MIRRALTCLLVGLVLAAAQVGPLRHGWWGLMDTMDLFMWNPPDAPLTLREVPHVIRTTEVGAFGRAERYRPAFYGLRVLETWAWEGRPERWYEARLAMFAFVLGGALFALWSLTTPLLATGAFALVAGSWYWSDIWARVGANEQYAAVGVALFAVGAAVALRSARPSLGLWLACAGGVLAAWSKENFVVMVVAMALLAWELRRARPVPALLTTLVVGLAAGTVLLELALASRYVTADIYGTPITTAVRLGWLRGPTMLMLIGVWSAIGVLALRAARGDRASPRAADGSAQRPYMEALRPLVLTLLLVTALVITQSTYYAPQWPRFGSRFDFPGRLLEPLLVVAGAIWCRTELRLAGRAPLVRVVELAVVTLGLSFAIRHQLFPVRAEAARVVRTTQALRARLTEARDAVAADPQAVLVLEAEDDATFAEACSSAIAMLAILGHRGPIYLRRPPGADASPLPSPALDAALRDGLRFAGGDVRPARELEAQLATPGRRAIILRMEYFRVPTLQLP